MIEARNQTINDMKKMYPLRDPLIFVFTMKTSRHI